MSLTTSYLGLKLKNPLVVAASSLSKSLDTVKEMEDAGASAIVMYSLFEEQIEYEKDEVDHFLSQGKDSFTEAVNYFTEPESFNDLDAEEYLAHLQKIKSTVSIPVIGSLNGVSPGGWMRYAKEMETAGADAIEVNIFYVPTDPNMTAQQVEQLYVDDLTTVKKAVNIPVAMKLSPFFSSFANLAKRLDEAGADGLVLFNRFFAPDIDLEQLEVIADLQLSSPVEIRLPLRWIAILKDFVKADIAATSGVHGAQDVLKLLMAGADVTMLASVLFKKQVKVIEQILTELKQWLEEHEYESVSQMKGSMSYKSVAEPAVYARANYMKMLHSL